MNKNIKSTIDGYKEMQRSFQKITYAMKNLQKAMMEFAEIEIEPKKEKVYKRVYLWYCSYFNKDEKETLIMFLSTVGGFVFGQIIGTIFFK